MTSHEIQEIIDENKQSIPDNVYLSISNANKRKYEEDKIIFVKVNFLCTTLNKPKKSQYSIGLNKKTQIVQYTEEEFNTLSDILDNHIICCKSINYEANYTGTFKNIFNQLICHNIECLDFFIKNEIIITSIKKLK